ncbi:hypothetical protein MTYP_01017 [Methylophilaceae bacterium]|nr:hypothetical protein MTYP_01017 [Methylophilaceae bacterium]
MNALTVTVQVSDLEALAGLISDLDRRYQPPTLENIDQCHSLIIKMLGEHVSLVYEQGDGSEVAA